VKIKKKKERKKKKIEYKKQDEIKLYIIFLTTTLT